MTIHGRPSGACGRCWRSSRSAPASRGSSESRRISGIAAASGVCARSPTCSTTTASGVRRCCVHGRAARMSMPPGAALARPATAWQAEFWRRLRARSASPSPAERLDAACAALIERPLAYRPAERISLFGLTRLPASYVQALAALATRPRRAPVRAAPLPCSVGAVDQVTAGPRPHERSRAGGLVLARARDTTGAAGRQPAAALVGCRTHESSSSC